MRSVSTLLRRLGAIEATHAPEPPEVTDRRHRASCETIIAEIEGEKARRLSPHLLPPVKCSLATLVYRWGSHWAPDDPAPADLERELLRRVKHVPPSFLAVTDEIERYREAMIAGDRERFFRQLTGAERHERWRQLMALCGAVERGEIPPESVPLICRPVPDDIDGPEMERKRT